MGAGPLAPSSALSSGRFENLAIWSGAKFCNRREMAWWNFGFGAISFIRIFCMFGSTCSEKELRSMRCFCWEDGLQMLRRKLGSPWGHPDSDLSNPGVKTCHETNQSWLVQSWFYWKRIGISWLMDEKSIDI